ncbi:ATPase [Methanobrevibacter sp.]|uniref:ATPase n=1 Tax=Methanobrevibacter sp. TaxID=66852 RepID=UPI00388E4758
MECYYHPSRESTDNCAICGKSICKECGLEIAGKVYCKDCLEKIVGLSLNNEAPKAEPAPEPVRLEKKETPAEQIEMVNLNSQTPREVQFTNQKIAEDSPYNIKDSLQYEGGLESNYPPRQTQAVPEQPVENVREEFIEPQKEEADPFMQEVLREPVQQARNEYDYTQNVQAPPADEYIYPDHSYEPQETTARRAVEDKYERYLDDLYFDEVDEVPLNEQLARDEEQYGSLTRHEYRPRNTHEQQKAADDELDRRIREELARREQAKNQPRREKIHNIQYEEEKEPYGAVDILLTVILIIVIIVVLFYILYVFILSASYPTFLDAVFGLRDPSTFIHNILG